MANWLPGLEEAPDDSVLRELLKSLDDARRKHSPLLHLAQQRIDIVAP
jgi:hypothetical protein